MVVHVFDGACYVAYVTDARPTSPQMPPNTPGNTVRGIASLD